MSPRRQSPFRLNAPRSTPLLDEDLRMSQNLHQHIERKVKSDRRRHQNASVDSSRRSNFSRLASDYSIHDIVMSAASESMPPDASFRRSEKIVVVPTTHAWPFKELFTKNTMKQELKNGLETVSPTSPSENFLDSCGLSSFQNPETCDLFTGQSNASRLRDNLSRMCTITYPQLRFVGGIADVVYVTGSLVTFSTLKERVHTKKSNKKKRKEQSIAIREELKNSSNSVNHDELKMTRDKNSRTQFARKNLTNSAA